MAPPVEELHPETTLILFSDGHFGRPTETSKILYGIDPEKPRAVEQAARLVETEFRNTHHHVQLVFNGDNLNAYDPKEIGESLDAWDQALAYAELGPLAKLIGRFQIPATVIHGNVEHPKLLNAETMERMLGLTKGSVDPARLYWLASNGRYTIFTTHGHVFDADVSPPLEGLMAVMNGCTGNVFKNYLRDGLERLLPTLRRNAENAREHLSQLLSTPTVATRIEAMERSIRGHVPAVRVASMIRRTRRFLTDYADVLQHLLENTADDAFHNIVVETVTEASEEGELPALTHVAIGHNHRRRLEPLSVEKCKSGKNVRTRTRPAYVNSGTFGERRDGRSTCVLIKPDGTTHLIELFDPNNRQKGINVLEIVEVR